MPPVGSGAGRLPKACRPGPFHFDAHDRRKCRTATHRRQKDRVFRQSSLAHGEGVGLPGTASASSTDTRRALRQGQTNRPLVEAVERSTSQPTAAAPRAAVRSVSVVIPEPHQARQFAHGRLAEQCLLTAGSPAQTSKPYRPGGAGPAGPNAPGRHGRIRRRSGAGHRRWIHPTAGQFCRPPAVPPGGPPDAEPGWPVRRPRDWSPTTNPSPCCPGPQAGWRRGMRRAPCSWGSPGFPRWFRRR